MTNFRRIEEKSYQHDAIKNAFIPGYGRKLLMKIVDRYQQLYDKHLLLRDVKIKDYPQWTTLGPSHELNLGILPKYSLNIKMARGGWYMNLNKSNGDYISIEDRKKIFDNPNNDSMFTTETRYVADMIGELRQWIIDLSL